MPHAYDDYEDDDALTRSVSLESYGDSYYTSNDEDPTAELLSSHAGRTPSRSLTALSAIASLSNWRRFGLRTYRRIKRTNNRQTTAASWLRRLVKLVYCFLGFLLAMTAVVGVFYPSYTTLPPHYKALQDRVKSSSASGSANVNNEKVFIAASIFDPNGHLAGGDWAKNVLELIHILGPENVYLSIYENDSGDEATNALSRLETQVLCNHTLVSEEHLDVEDLPNVVLQNGERRVKRIAYLAEVRNRALRPLEQATIRFDKLLYLNDVMFNPIEAAQLLFLTHSNHQGQTQYRAACAVDFINAFKFYDTFATRDLDGFSMGVPFFPWFSAIGGDSTLDDVLSDNDAVRVKSCWGGMVAFDARFFQNWNGEAEKITTAAGESPVNITAPYRFRADPDLWWDASECCLIQADIQNPDKTNTEIYVNPYVRVAYDSRTLSWLWFSKRIEKLYPPIHFIADWLVNLPHYNPRRHEKAWEMVEEMVWDGDGIDNEHGHWRMVQRLAKHDGFCGKRALQVLTTNSSEGQRNWEVFDPPPIFT